MHPACLRVNFDSVTRAKGRFEVMETFSKNGVRNIRQLYTLALAAFAGNSVQVPVRFRETILYTKKREKPGVSKIYTRITYST